jgi:hypothetical protein
MAATRSVVDVNRGSPKHLVLSFHFEKVCPVGMELGVYLAPICHLSDLFAPSGESLGRDYERVLSHGG